MCPQHSWRWWLLSTVIHLAAPPLGIAFDIFFVKDL